MSFVLDMLESKALKRIKIFKNFLKNYPHCYVCKIPLIFQAFMGIEEDLVTTTQCPECGIHWGVNEKLYKQWVYLIGGKKRIIRSLIQESIPPPKPKHKINYNINFEKIIMERMMKFEHKLKEAF